MTSLTSTPQGEHPGRRQGRSRADSRYQLTTASPTDGALIARRSSHGDGCSAPSRPTEDPGAQMDRVAPPPRRVYWLRRLVLLVILVVVVVLLAHACAG